MYIICVRVRVMAMCKYRCTKLEWDALIEEGDGAEIEDGIGDVEEHQRRRGHNLLVWYMDRLGGGCERHTFPSPRSRTDTTIQSI